MLAISPLPLSQDTTIGSFHDVNFSLYLTLHRYAGLRGCQFPANHRACMTQATWPDTAVPLQECIHAYIKPVCPYARDILITVKHPSTVWNLRGNSHGFLCYLFCTTYQSMIWDNMYGFEITLQIEDNYPHISHFQAFLEASIPSFAQLIHLQFFFLFSFFFLFFPFS